jgi:carbonic anhydrase
VGRARSRLSDTCAIGGEQSPVDLKGAIKAEIHAPVLSWKPQAFKVVNNGHTIQANAAPGSFASSENRKFELKQFHFHTPSEHAIQGKRAQMEAHFVHAEDSGELLVLGVLMEPSSKKVRNKAFAALMAAAPETEGDAELKGRSMPCHSCPKNVSSFATRARSQRPPARNW